MKKENYRTCFVSRKKFLQKELIRFYINKDKILQRDIEKEKRNKGIYLKLTSKNLILFIKKKNYFSKKLKCLISEKLILSLKSLKLQESKKYD